MSKKYILSVIFIIFIIIYYTQMQKVETMQYDIITQDGNIELRQYPSFITASTTAKGNRKEAISTGFKSLANYIFGQNKNPENNNVKIAMTAPVLQYQYDHDWIIKFIMPSIYNLNNLPLPDNKSIKIQQEQEAKYAAISFSGVATTKTLNDHLKKLKSYLILSKIATHDEVIYAFYNPPWTLPFIRRNEILIKIKES